jgi:ankyrin repeat protein
MSNVSKPPSRLRTSLKGLPTKVPSGFSGRLMNLLTSPLVIGLVVLVALAGAGLLVWQGLKPAAPVTPTPFGGALVPVVSIPAPNNVALPPAPTGPAVPAGPAQSSFVGVDLAAVRAVNSSDAPPEQSPTVAMPIGQVLDRQLLAAEGYAYSAEGFLTAARQGNLPILKAFLATGMAPTAQNTFGSTALHAVAEANQPESAKLLLAAGAPLEATTPNGQTPLHRAVATNHAAMAMLLLTAGANLHATTQDGWTPLFYAVDNANRSLTRQLIIAGSRLQQADRFGNTPVMLAVRNNQMGLAKDLITMGANLNAQDVQGRTALHYAASAGRYQLTKFLLENKAKPNLPDRQGMQPMDIALANNDLAIANLLLAFGASRPQTLGE